MRRLTSAIGALIAATLLLAIPGYADSISGNGRVAAPAAAPAGPAFKTGCWVGAKVDTQNTDVGFATVNDLLYGAGVGCDFIYPGTGLLLGAFGDVSIPHGTIGSDSGVDAAWFVGIRGGVLLSDRLLAYGLVGGTGQDFSIPETKTNDIGLTIGAGAELMLTPNWSTGVEWRRINIDVSGDEQVLTQDIIGVTARYRF